ncbi:KH domain-containing, RNA-binding, signal transduction-associated protein 3 [Merluccius polli]|uniref:KH domain-containing, RNA-binding, signal transduction-associated protein 1 n=1 Tax=Merluccius polli TaxID=89951 RepID=A0AA47N7C5_MERPO|nr:KH domain-containing, RNA-binding, signal transduction-associated protein 3 [Merluccius polli]
MSLTNAKLKPDSAMDASPAQKKGKMDDSKYLPELLAEKDSLDSSFTHAMKLISAEIERVQKGETLKDEKETYLDLFATRNLKLKERVLIPTKQYPRVNFVGKILGPQGNTIKRLQEETGAKISVLGKGSMRDKNKEEELRKGGEAKYAHLSMELHVFIEVTAPIPEAYLRMAHAMDEVKKFLIPYVCFNRSPVSRSSTWTLTTSMAHRMAQAGGEVVTQAGAEVALPMLQDPGVGGCHVVGRLVAVRHAGELTEEPSAGAVHPGERWPAGAVLPPHPTEGAPRPARGLLHQGHRGCCPPRPCHTSSTSSHPPHSRNQNPMKNTRTHGLNPDQSGNYVLTDFLSSRLQPSYEESYTEPTYESYENYYNQQPAPADTEYYDYGHGEPQEPTYDAYTQDDWEGSWPNAGAGGKVPPARQSKGGYREHPYGRY